MSESRQDETWDEVITSQHAWLDLRLSELWRYRHLVRMFVRRDFVATYKQTILGPLWFLIPPILSSVTFTIIFGKIAQLPTDGQPQFLFYMSGVIIWGYFSATLTGNSAIFSSQSGLFSKIYFPRLAVPMANLISGLAAFAIQLAIFAAFLIYYVASGATVRPNLTIIYLPFIIAIAGILGLSFGIIASALTTRYRDLSFLINFGLSLWMYVTPVIYPLSAIPEKYQWIAMLNPTAPIVVAFRHAFLGVGTFPTFGLMYTGVFAVAIFVLGAMIFNRVGRYSMDTI